jgi:hypothetical protein
MNYKVIGGGRPEEAGRKAGRKIKKKKKKKSVEGSREMMEMLNKNYAINGDDPSITLGQ